MTGLLVCCIACNQPATNNENNADTSVVKVDDSHISTTPIPLDGCYSMTVNNDTATLRLNVIDSMVTGQLSYHWKEKDHNDGTLKGVVRDSLIIADYTFRSEGMLSVRQVVFKMNGTSLTEGYGDLNTSSDTVRFKNIASLNYLYDRPFLKKPCIE